MDEIPAYYRYWGKAQHSEGQVGDAYHLLPYHCLDVAAVGFYLLAPERPLTKDLAAFLELEPAQLQRFFSVCLGLHDLGKFALAFQLLYPAETPALVRGQCRKEYDGRHYRHDRLGLYFWHAIRRSVNNDNASDHDHFSEEAWEVMMDVVLGHHGCPVLHEQVRGLKDFTQPADTEAAIAFSHALLTLFQPDLPWDRLATDSLWCDKLRQVSWHLAGIAVLADWLGSDQSFFPYCASTSIPLAAYWNDAQAKAQRALMSIDLACAPEVHPFQSIRDHYGFAPTPLQRWVEQVEIDREPQLFILEDITGAGKTEAALALTHRLMAADAADGFYFGLPTMATSNAMFNRVADHYQQMLGSKDAPTSIVLAHGAREMNDRFREAVLATERDEADYARNDQTATAQCRQWLADSRKKALLAPVGVGTIDQALLAVLPRRHQSLRLLGLHRKVLIFDEVHAADDYMFELLEVLLALHLRQGGSVILLTATLPLQQRQRLVNIWQSAAGLPSTKLKETAFPLVTKVSSRHPVVLEQVLESRSDVVREVEVTFLHSEQACLDTIQQAVAAQQCVVWIRNSVNDALAAYTNLKGCLSEPDKCLLFHSRFTLQDRKQIECQVLEALGKHGSAQQRAGFVLVATQVFQESLDADADVMISDICPIDDLIQRMGRLQRHTRTGDGVYQAGVADNRTPVIHVHAPVWQEVPDEAWLQERFRNTQYVYRSPGRLWLGIRALRRLETVRIPENARELIESVYSDQAQADIPEAMKTIDDGWLGEGKSKAAQAYSRSLRWEYGYSSESSDYWQEDNADIGTRLSDIDTVDVVLFKIASDAELRLWGDCRSFAVQLSTLKLSKSKYADRLTPIPEAYQASLDSLCQRYTQLRFKQCWLPEVDPEYGYSPELGFYERDKKAQG